MLSSASTPAVIALRASLAPGVLRSSLPVRRHFANSGSKSKVAVLPGDGIGKEVTDATVKVLQFLNAPLTFVHGNCGFEHFQKHGKALPDETVALLESCHGAIFGAVSSPSHRVEGYSSPIVEMRKRLDLYANIRPVISSPIDGVRQGINFVIVRENTECLYVKKEKQETTPEGRVATASRIISEKASRRIAVAAFELALKREQQYGRPGKVTIVHKANVLPITDGLFRETALEVSKNPKYKGIAVEEQLVDSCVYRTFLFPESFDVVVAPNMYGDIVSDGAAAVVGGLGVVPSANTGDKFVMVEPVHGSAPDIVGKGIANPIATIRAAGLLLEYLGQAKYATALEHGIQQVIARKEVTPDLKGKLGTEAVSSKIAEYARARLSQ